MSTSIVETPLLSGAIYARLHLLFPCWLRNNVPASTTMRAAVFWGLVLHFPPPPPFSSLTCWHLLVTNRLLLLLLFAQAGNFLVREKVSGNAHTATTTTAAATTHHHHHCLNVLDRRGGW